MLYGIEENRRTYQVLRQISSPPNTLITSWAATGGTRVTVRLVQCFSPRLYATNGQPPVHRESHATNVGNVYLVLVLL